MNFALRNEADRTRRNTPRAINRRIDRQTETNLRNYSVRTPQAIDRRIAELRSEWSIERYLQLNVAAVGLSGIALALAADRRWAYATCAALAMFMTHQLQGFDPPLPLLRKLGIRTREEIDEEIYALKVMRGDFDAAEMNPATATTEEVESVIRAVGA